MDMDGYNIELEEMDYIQSDNDSDEGEFSFN